VLTNLPLDMGTDHSRPGGSLVPQGVVLHSTATPEATARNVRDYFNGPPPRSASAHFAVDWVESIIMIPVNEMAWGAGPTANHRYLHIELCETRDAFKFHDSFLAWIALARELFTLFGWPVDPQHLWSHKMISDTFHESTHVDPIPYLVSHNHTWDDVVARIKGA
jgi:N-acetylmuramoyl-L-alanine amidase